MSSARSVTVLLTAIPLLVSCSDSNATSHLQVPTLPTGSATFVAASSTTQHPCAGNGYARNDENGKCYHLLSAPILSAKDIASTYVVDNPSPPPVREINIDLRPDAADRLDRYAAAHPGGTLAVLTGSAVIAAPSLDSPPYHGMFTIGDPSWTEADAQHVVEALSGPHTTHQPVFSPSLPSVAPSATQTTRKP